MKKSLSEMTTEELWTLFPIILSKHDPVWREYFFEEMGLLSEILPHGVIIAHIGSTAVPGIMAKPIVDILIEAEEGQFTQIDALLREKCGYRLMAEEDRRRDYNKGYTEEGFAEKVYHLHLRVYGDNDELYFRDYLIEHEETAREYEHLKKALVKQYKYNRDAYTRAKGYFVAEFTQKAKEAYKDKYSV